MSEEYRVTVNLDQTLDVTGLACPLPLLKMKLALNGMTVGQCLYVKATDAGSWQDFHKFVEMTDHQLLEAVLDENCYHYVLKKGY